MKKSIGAKTLMAPHPMLIVGSYDGQDVPNLMAVAWGGICCSKPPSVAISLRRATKTHQNISQRGAFTVNMPSRAHVRPADYVGIASGHDVEKFPATGLTPVSSERVDAPYVDEFPVVLECAVRHVFEIGLHTQFVGEILDVKADPAVLGANGQPDIEKVQPFVYATGNQAYYAIGPCLQPAFTTTQLERS